MVKGGGGGGGGGAAAAAARFTSDTLENSYLPLFSFFSLPFFESSITHRLSE